MDKRPNIAPIMIISGLCGAGIGLFTWLFMLIYEQVITLIWTKGEAAFDVWYFPLIICGVGGIFVGLAYKFFAPVPEPIAEALVVIRKTKRLEYDHLRDAVVAAFASLVFGGSVGPEAGLTSIIGGLCTWVGDKNKACFRLLHEKGKITFAEIFSLLRINTRDAAFPSSGGTKTAKDNPDYLADYFSRRKLVIVPALFVGLFVFFLLQNTPLRNEPWVFNHFPNAATPGIHEYLALLALVLMGVVLGFFNSLSQKILDSLNILKTLTSRYRVIASVFGGLVLGACAIWFPYVLFSGELQMQEVVLQGTMLSAGFLIATAFLKMFLTNLILACGWKGGQIFPIIFSGFALGLGCAIGLNHLGFTLDPAWCVAAICAAAASIALGQPALVALLMLPLFPWQSWPAIIVSALIIMLFQRLTKQRLATKH